MQNVIKVQTRLCGEVCNRTSRCVDDGCQKVCVQALSFCELHSASESGVLSKVKVILTKGHADINCKEWIGRTPVVVAAEKGHRTVVEFLVNNGADMSVIDNYGMTILHCACQAGHVEVVKYILSKETVDINGKVGCGGTPVMLAARNGHQVVVEILVSKGADLSLTNKRGENILHVSCWGGHVEVVKYILSQNTININSVDLSRKTPVMVAQERGRKDVVELLLSKGADKLLDNKRIEKRKKRLHRACRRGDVDEVKRVLQQDNAVINSRGKKRVTPVIMAAIKGHKEVVEFLISKRADMSLVDTRGWNVLHAACQGGNVEMVKYVLSQNILDINSLDKGKRTPLIMASKKGHKDVVELLLSKGADTTLVSNVGDSFFHAACRGGDVEMVKYALAQVDVDINIRGLEEKTPLIEAAEKGHMEIVEVLVNKGADKSLVDQSGNNILHAACRGGNVEMVKYILKQDDVYINSRGSDGMTPLIVAAGKGHMEVFELLVNKGADTSLIDESGNNILHAACRGGDVEMVKYILSNVSVDINARNDDGDTAADIAEEHKLSDIMNLF